MKNIQEKLFLGVSFFLGTWGAVYNITLTVLIGIALLYNIYVQRLALWAELKKAKYYIGISVFFILYLLLHTLITLWFFKEPYKPKFGSFESVIFFFLLVSLYVMSVRNFMSVRLIWQFLLVYCISVLTFNMASLFYLGGEALFTDPVGTLVNLYASRFGGTKEIFGGLVYLDAQALNLSVAALISYLMILFRPRMWEKIAGGVMVLFLVLFLSLTVTKSPILSFFLGFIILSLCIFRRLSLKYRGGVIALFLLAGISGSLFLPDAFVKRWGEAKKEIGDVMAGNIDAGGATITPRVAMFKACIDHTEEFALCGMGVYTNPIVKQWFQDSENKNIGQYTHCHNSFLQYWMIGGICGLIFIFSWFVFPLWQMIRDGRYSYFILAVMLTFFLDNNAAVLLIVNDSTSFIVFFLALFYFYRDYFYAIENGGHAIPSVHGERS